MNSALARCNNSANAAGRGPRSGPGESESVIAMLVIDLSPPTPYGVSTTESRHFAHNRVKKVDRAQGGAVHKTGPRCTGTSTLRRSVSGMAGQLRHRRTVPWYTHVHMSPSYAVVMTKRSR